MYEKCRNANKDIEKIFNTIRKEEKKNIINTELERINNKIEKLKDAKKVLEGKINLIDEGKI